LASFTPAADRPTRENESKRAEKPVFETSGRVVAMKTGLFSHTDCLGHAPPRGHPECPARLEAVLKALDGPEFRGLRRETAPPASRESLLRVHASSMVGDILDRLDGEARAAGYAAIDGDTVMSPGSATAALRAAGAVIAAVDSVMAGATDNAFCAVRPPGHHAERARAMGFCLFNNIAAGAMHARAVHGLSRIAVVDFDVHHGNGTQDIFFDDSNLFYASTHQMPLYPGTGFANERGVAGNVLNRPLRPGAGSTDFRAIYSDFVLPELESFAPEFIFISAGFDAHRDDPLAQLNLVDDDFHWVTREICAIAARVCGNRVVSSLEGGYDLDALARSSAAHVRALMEA
jgi:acetoin utilization deacetylase AcuC-like enzyme